ncbi:hypothetical protein KA013_02445 [Patescibacteria group bacterium]|nr:hypothetical protein [Patescibacteria group bacterium]
MPELEALLIDMAVPTTRNEILQLDMRKERSIEADKFFDIDQVVPVKV